MKLTSAQVLSYKTCCDVFIGIDPDSDKSGVALLMKKSRALTVGSFSFPELIDYVKAVRAKYCESHILVVVEGGWLNESNWHVKYTPMSTSKAAAMGRNVGMNHQTGILIVQILDYLDIPFDVVKPLAKGWCGKDGKITAEELAYFTGYNGRTNQDGRDAALLAWEYAGLPVKVKPIGG